MVGGGPGGSTLAWDLARHGVDVTVLERTRFPREKVCGDYVEPRGLRILRRMGCLERLEAVLQRIQPLRQLLELRIARMLAKPPD